MILANLNLKINISLLFGGVAGEKISGFIHGMALYMVVKVAIDLADILVPIVNININLCTTLDQNLGTALKSIQNIMGMEK